MKQKKLIDQNRKRRDFPHQMDADKFYKRLSLIEILNLFVNVYMALCRIIALYLSPTQKWRFLVDNTEYHPMEILPHLMS
ncbi:hypothetical protein [Candidatus Lokiarchaeum ossiferum]